MLAVAVFRLNRDATRDAHPLTLVTWRRSLAAASAERPRKCKSQLLDLQAGALLASGDLPGAAKALQAGTEGTAAADVVLDWIRAAQARAAADQAARLLKAHATVLSGSLS